MASSIMHGDSRRNYNDENIKMQNRTVLSCPIKTGGLCRLLISGLCIAASQSRLVRLLALPCHHSRRNLKCDHLNRGQFGVVSERVTGQMRSIRKMARISWRKLLLSLFRAKCSLVALEMQCAFVKKSWMRIARRHPFASHLSPNPLKLAPISHWMPPLN